MPGWPDSEADQLMSDVDPLLRPFIFVLVTASMLDGPSRAQIETYAEGSPGMKPFMEEVLDELIKVGALCERDDRYYITVMGEMFLKTHMPGPAHAHQYVRKTLSIFQSADGASMEGLAKLFGSKESDPIFRQLIERFVEMGTLEFRDGGYYVSDRARQMYQLARIN